MFVEGNARRRFVQSSTGRDYLILFSEDWMIDRHLKDPGIRDFGGSEDPYSQGVWVLVETISIGTLVSSKRDLRVLKAKQLASGEGSRLFRAFRRGDSTSSVHCKHKC